jgi:hypothetical protein
MAAEHEKRRPADDSEQMVIRRWGKHIGAKHLDRPQLPGLVCMLAGRREFQLAGGWRIARGASESVLLLVSSSSTRSRTSL